METIEKEKSIDVVRQMVADGLISQEVAEKYFPELKESEGERIRKKLVQFFKEKDEEDFEEWVPKAKVLAWFESQGEQKPTDTKNLETAISNILKVYSHIILHRSLTQDELKETDVYAAENTKKLLCFLEQKPAEWSEEDERKKNKLIWIFEEIKKGANYFYGSDVKETIDWLKSLKERYTWKPSVAQLNALSIVSKGYVSDDIEAIASLYNDLKKLREE